MLAGGQVGGERDEANDDEPGRGQQRVSGCDELHSLGSPRAESPAVAEGGMGDASPVADAQLAESDGKDGVPGILRTKATVDSVVKVFASKVQVVLRVSGSSSASAEEAGAAVPQDAWDGGAFLSLEWRCASLLHRSMRLVKVMAVVEDAGSSRCGVASGVGARHRWLQPRGDPLLGLDGEMDGAGGREEGHRLDSPAEADVLEDFRVLVQGVRCSYEGAGVRHTVLSSNWEEADRSRHRAGAAEGQEPSCKDAASVLSLFSGTDGAVGGNGEASDDDGKYPFHTDVAGTQPLSCAHHHYILRA